MYVIKPVGLSLVSISEAENDAETWMAGNVYGIGAQVIRGHVVYVSSVDGNAGNDPSLEVQELEGARWVKVSATNNYRFFEGTLSTKTVGQSPLVIEVGVDDAFNTLAIFGLECSRCVIEVVTGGVAKTVADFSMGPEPVGDWVSWLRSSFFRSAQRRVITDAHGFSSSVLRLTITGPSPALGELVVGRIIKIGDTLMRSDTVVSRRTFTTVSTNAFGVTTSQKRAIARDVTYAVRVNRDGFSAKERFLDDADGVRVVTLALPEAWETLINYGFLTDYEIPVDLPDDHFMTFTNQGVS